MPDRFQPGDFVIRRRLQSFEHTLGGTPVIGEVRKILADGKCVVHWYTHPLLRLTGQNQQSIVHPRNLRPADTTQEQAR